MVTGRLDLEGGAKESARGTGSLPNYAWISKRTLSLKIEAQQFTEIIDR